MSFRALHVPGQPFVMPNPWDVGSAYMFATLGFSALASTSAGAAFARGLHDGALSLDEKLADAVAIKGAVSVPVSADLENCGGAAAQTAAQAIGQAGKMGLDGASIEDFSNDPTAPIYDFALSVERVEAAVEAAKPSGLVLTARAEAMLNPNPDFNDVLARITAFSRAGADVVFAPGLVTGDQVRAVVRAAGDTPVSVLVGPGTELTIPVLANLGVARVSVGSALARLAYGAALDMAEQIRDHGTFSYPDNVASFARIEGLLPKA
ncbi:MAG: isocitrate lyase/phosphoenolpyruvate mutase family protein [Sedimentitalea sp.]